MDRRQFLSYSAAALAAGALTPASADAKQRIGLQLFSMPKMLERTFVRESPSSPGWVTPRWSSTGPIRSGSLMQSQGGVQLRRSLDSAGSGFFGLTAAQVHSILGEHRIAAPSMHTDLLTLQQGEWAHLPKPPMSLARPMSRCRPFPLKRERAWMTSNAWRIVSTRSIGE